MIFQTRFKHDVVPGIVFIGDSLTQQCFERECNINTIVESFTRSGTLPVASGTPVYGDFSQVGDFAAIQNKLLETQEAFDSLPSDVRKRFANNPAELVAFVGDENNRDEAIRLGLIPSPVVDNSVGDSSGV